MKKSIRPTLTFTLALMLGASLAPLAQGQELTGTLKHIKDTNTIVLGHRESSVPYSYFDNSQHVVGYSQEIALIIVEDIKKALGTPDLQVKLIPINAQNRIPLIQNGTINMECGGTTNNLERRKQADFSDTISITETRLLTKRDSNIHSFDDIVGKTVVVTAGTTSERYLKKYINDKKLNIELISSRDHAESFLMVETGRAAAFFMDADVLAGERAKSAHPDDYVIAGEPQTHEAIACMLPKGDLVFKALVDKSIARIETDGETQKLYTKWFMSPIPPKGINLNYPLSDSLKAVFNHPNDTSLDE
jgi:glutamate/aspartate transport system substrate-binding protein